MDPHNAFMRFVDSQMVPPKGSNWGYINDAELDALAAEARRTSDVEALDKVLARINTRMVDQALFVWVVGKSVTESAVRVGLLAGAQDMEGASKDPVGCGTTGVLEGFLSEEIRKRAALLQTGGQ